MLKSSSLILPFFVALLLAGCGNLGGPGNAAHGPFAAEVNYFIQAGEARGVTGLRGLTSLVPIEYGPLDENETGRCEFNLLTGRRIIINQDLRNTASVLYIQTILLHELGHCVLNRRHHDGIISIGGGPTSLMHQSARFVAEFYEANEGMFLDELFH